MFCETRVCEACVACVYTFATSLSQDADNLRRMGASKIALAARERKLSSRSGASSPSAEPLTSSCRCCSAPAAPQAPVTAHDPVTELESSTPQLRVVEVYFRIDSLFSTRALFILFTFSKEPGGRPARHGQQGFPTCCRINGSCCFHGPCSFHGPYFYGLRCFNSSCLSLRLLLLSVLLMPPSAAPAATCTPDSRDAAGDKQPSARARTSWPARHPVLNQAVASRKAGKGRAAAKQTPPPQRAALDCPPWPAGLQELRAAIP